jgi:hypothetical protein
MAQCSNYCVHMATQTITDGTVYSIILVSSRFHVECIKRHLFCGERIELLNIPYVLGRLVGSKG